MNQKTFIKTIGCFFLFKYKSNYYEIIFFIINLFNNLLANIKNKHHMVERNE